MEVFKFGGASVKNAAGVINVANIIRTYKSDELLVVVSAMGKTTDALEKLYKSYLAQDDEMHKILADIKDFHFQIAAELFAEKSKFIQDDISNTFVEIEWMLEDDPDQEVEYIYDQIVSIGEVVSTKILAAYLNHIGVNTQWIDARNFIKTDNTYREGKVDWAKTDQLIQRDLPIILTKEVIVTQGFIGGTSENYTTTLGRDGSDYSAGIFASCLNAQSLTIWKDVPGVLNADPKWFDVTEKIKQLSYHDAIELTYYGANVIHPKTIKPLQNKNIPLIVRSFLEPTGQGTLINENKNPLPVSSFIFKINQALISVSSKDYSFIMEDGLSDIFELFHKNKVKINTMQNSAISFSASVDDDEQKVKNLINDLSQNYKVKYNRNLELVTIRYYNTETIERVSVDKDILLEVKSRYTCQMVMKNIN